MNGGAVSQNDHQVLEAIFNPEHPIIGLQLPDPSASRDVSNADHDVCHDTNQLKAMEAAAVKLAEGDDLTGALDILNKLIASSPNYSSAYNNRAQVYRLLGQVDEAMLDLNEAIRISGGCGKSAEQAYTQRGLVHMLHGNESEALSDFQVAAALGSQFAQRQVVKLNPYSKLCNQMLSEAMNKLSGK